VMKFSISYFFYLFDFSISLFIFFMKTIGQVFSYLSFFCFLVFLSPLVLLYFLFSRLRLYCSFFSKTITFFYNFFTTITNFDIGLSIYWLGLLFFNFCFYLCMTFGYFFFGSFFFIFVEPFLYYWRRIKSFFNYLFVSSVKTLFYELIWNKVVLKFKEFKEELIIILNEY